MVYFLIFVLWCFGMGFSARLLEEESAAPFSAIIAVSVVLWPVILLFIWGHRLQRAFTKYLSYRREYKRTKTIVLVNGKIADLDQYKQLESLIIQFKNKYNID